MRHQARALLAHPASPAPSHDLPCHRRACRGGGGALPTSGPAVAAAVAVAAPPPAVPTPAAAAPPPAAQTPAAPAAPRAVPPPLFPGVVPATWPTSAAAAAPPAPPRQPPPQQQPQRAPPPTAGPSAPAAAVAAASTPSWQLCWTTDADDHSGEAVSSMHYVPQIAGLPGGSGHAGEEPPPAGRAMCIMAGSVSSCRDAPQGGHPTAVLRPACCRMRAPLQSPATLLPLQAG